MSVNTPRSLRARTSWFCALSLLLSGCYVNVSGEHAKVARLSGNDSLGDIDHPAFRVSIELSRNSFKKIADYQLISHIVITDCKTGNVITYAEPFWQGAPIDDPELLSRKIESTQGDNFTLEGDIEDSTLNWSAACASLSGGGYILQKITSRPIRIEMVQPQSVLPFPSVFGLPPHPCRGHRLRDELWL